MEDHFDIKTLPSNFVSHSHPSKIIEKLNAKRKIEHSAVIEKMNIRVKEVNIEIEEDILRESNNIKTKMTKLREDTDYFLFLTLHMKEHELPPLEKKYFQNISNKISESNETRKTYVDELYNSLVEIEKKRSEKLKLILNEVYTNLLDISYNLPFELEEFFENEILKTNQLMMNNYQHYSKLKAELKLQIENDMKVWMQKLFEIKDKFKKHLKDLATQEEEHAKTIEYDAGIRSIQMNRRFSEYDAMKMVLEFKLSQLNIHVGLENIHSWLQDVQMTMACLDKSAKYIVTIYKAAIVVIFHRFFKELEDIKTSMLDLDMLNREYIEPYECEIYTPTVEELNLQTDKELTTLQKVWGNLINYIEDALNETYKFVKKSTYLWDQHFLRTEEAQTLVLEDVNNVIERNIILEEITETKLNYILDKLRQSPTEQKLATCLISDVIKSLENIEEMYRIHNLEEQKVVEKYREFINIEIDVLMAEIKRFLTLHPPDEERDPKKQRKRASQESQINIDPTEELIPSQMLFCRYQVDAVSNWMFGLWEAINNYLTCGRADIMAIAEQWIKLQSEKIKGRLKIKLVFCRSRFERIKCSVYEKRLEELDRHSAMLKRHQLAIEMEITTLTNDQKSNEEKYNHIQNMVSDETEKIVKQIVNLNRSSQVHRYKESLKILTREATDSVTSILDESNESCDKLAENIKISNLKYRRAIRLFSENGNYNIEEAKYTIKTINKLDANAAKRLEQMKKNNIFSNANYKKKLEVVQSEASLSVKEIMEEHEHNEKTVREIVKLQNEIRDLVVTAKTPIMMLKKLFKNLMETSSGKFGETYYLQSFANKAQEILEQINMNASILIHPEPIILYSTANIEQSATNTIKLDYKDFIEHLFYNKPNESDEYFVSKLNNFLYNSFCRIQMEAKEFYFKRKIRLNFPKIQPTYDDFMEEVLQKYRNFLVQGEICWVQTASDFLNITANFLNFKKQFLLKFENTFYENAHKNYKKVHNDILKELHNEKENLENTYKNMHSQLKILHGHPNNKQLLEQLKLKFKILVKDTGNKLEYILQPHMAVLFEEFQNLRNSYEKTRNELNCLSENGNLEDYTTLRRHLEIKLDLMRKIQEEYERDSESSEDERNEDVPISISKQILSYMKNLQGATTQTKTDLVSSFTLISETYEEPTPRDFLNELQEHFEKYKQNITDFVDNKLFKYHNEFQLTWSNDIENILNLYKVKYDKKNM